MARKEFINIENTRFIYRTNFSGDPKRDEKYHSTTRKGNIIIPTYEQAMDLLDAGFKVRQTQPRPGEEEGFIPIYFVSICAQYRNSDGTAKSTPPKIYIVTNDEDPYLLEEDMLNIVDDAYVLNVNVMLSGWENPNTGTKSLYIKTMYVEQEEDDIYASRYNKQNRESNFDEE